MNIGFDISALRSGADGVGYTVYALWRALTKQPDVSVHPIAPYLTLKNGYVPNQDFIRLPTRLAWMQWHLPHELKTSSFDLLHFPNYLASLNNSLPFIVNFYDLSVFRYPQMQPLRRRMVYRLLIRQVLNKASRIITPTQTIADELSSTFDIAPDRISPIWLAAHSAYRRLMEWEKQEHKFPYPQPYLLAVGTLQPRKNYLTLLQAIDRLKTRGIDVPLLIVGRRGWLDHQIFGTIKERKLEKNVILLGYQPIANLLELYNHAHALVFPSIYEGFGMPLVEAMACGIPIIASDIPTFREVCAKAAVFVPPLAVEAWEEAIEKMLIDTEHHHTMRLLATLRASRFSWDATASEVVKIYKEIIYDGPPPSHRSTPNTHISMTDSRPSDKLNNILYQPLCYFKLFQHPLTIRELHYSLPWLPIPFHKLQSYLEQHTVHSIQIQNGYVALADSAQVLQKMIQHRQARERQFAKLLQEHHTLLRRLTKLPYVKMIALSGGGMFGTDVKDIDLFIITRKHRTAIVFCLAVLLARLMRQRKTLCVNYIIDEDNLHLHERDFYTAIQFIHLKPVFGYESYLSLWQANPSLLRRFPNAHPVPPDILEENAMSVTLCECALNLLGARLINRILTHLVRRRMDKKATKRSSITVKTGIFKLHLNDYRTVILRRWKKLLHSLSAKPHKF